MRFNYAIKYGPTCNGMDTPDTLVVLVYNYDGRFDTGAQS